MRRQPATRVAAPPLQPNPLPQSRQLAAPAPPHRWPGGAVEVDGERRERIWAQALKVYPGYATYERRASHRRIGVFLLEPR
jgi:F420H(2)-dependent quinone reductase